MPAWGNYPPTYLPIGARTRGRSGIPDDLRRRV